MPRADAVDEADREAAANGTLSLPAAATSYDYLSLVPVAAVGIVLLYLSLVFVFAALGG